MTIGHLLILSVTLISCSVVGQYQVVGPTQAIVAAPGDDVILPCYVEPPLNVEELTVDWWRPDIPSDSTDPLSQYRYVHHYHEERDVDDMKISSYSGRTAIFKDELKFGNTSLKIMNVTLSDQGRYKCVLPQLGRATVIKLTVEHVKTRMTETPPPTRNFTTSVSINKEEIKGVQYIPRLSLAMVVWVIIILCFGVSGYLLHKSQNYLPKYTPMGELESRVFLPLKPI